MKETISVTVQEQIALIKNIIVDTVPVEQIYLFGSYAYGKPQADSDLDFYVILNDDAPYRDLEAMDRIGLALYGHKSMPTDILVAKKSRFQYRVSAPTLEQEVVEKGVLIYG
ncbi:nucleotidyltransferase domain-containing protein [Treponema primitia]|uniref:nucleotidyltransferase domain-containing protein n=1 Tax=Treponema primitia TaxID=88058 RepID=UPI0039817BB4